MRCDVPVQCKVHKHSPRRRPQHPQELPLFCRAPSLPEFVLIQGYRGREPTGCPEMIRQITVTHTLDVNPAARACCARSATRVCGKIAPDNIASYKHTSDLPYPRTNYLCRSQSGLRIFYPPTRFPAQMKQIWTRGSLNPE